MATRASYAIRHLLARLRMLNIVIDAAANKRAKLGELFVAAGAKPDAITRGHVDAVLGYVHKLHEHLGLSVGTPPAIDDENEWEADIRNAAQADGVVLPLDALAAAFELTEFEQEALALCAAPAVDAVYGIAFAFLHDDQAARAPSIDLVASLTAPDLGTLVERRAVLGPLGRLRRLGLLAIRPRGHSYLQHELLPTDAAVHLLFGGAGDPAVLFQDPAEVAIATDAPAPLGIDLERCMKMATALVQGTIDTIGIFGGRDSTRREVVRYIAARTGHPLRRLLPAEDPRAALETAAALHAILWIDIDCFEEAALGPCAPLAVALSRGRVAAVITGTHPWRPPRVLEVRAYAEIPATEVPLALRRSLWLQELPELDHEKAGELALRFRFGGPEIRAASNMARATAHALQNGHAVHETVDDACAAIARPASIRFGRLIEARRQAADLVLPPAELRQVQDIVRLHRLAPKVLEEWGFSAKLTSAGGVKALFAGDPGTGKTLAAEIVANQLGLPLFKVDLARVVSKWVGETEKNLDAAFREAEDSHAILFFDEAEALFGARADVRTGADRYANLEVSFLLQRLDAFSGVAILASNLRDKIDAAFTRRFHVVIAFPRPQEPERRSLWRLAFPTRSDGTDILECDVDLLALARFDLTGAGIFSTAQAAAFLAADEGAEQIAMRHVVRGLARQFQREARVLTTDDLGLHACHLAEAR